MSYAISCHLTVYH